MKVDLEKSKQKQLLIETVEGQKYLQVVSATVKCSAQDRLPLKFGCFPRNFQIFIFKPEMSFLKANRINDNMGEFLDLNEFTLYMNS